MSCKIDKSIAFDCDAPQQGGIQAYIYALNFSEILTATVTVDGSTEEITDITLTVSGDVGYKFAVPKSSNLLPSSPLRVIEGVDGFDHTLQCRLNTIEQLDRKNLARVRFNKLVNIVKYLEGRMILYGASVKDPTGTPELIGVGMRVSEWDDQPSDPGLSATVGVTWKTPDNDPPEIHPPHIIASAFDPETLLTPIV